MQKLFFVIPVYKVEDYLCRCIDSVLAQTASGVEIVLIDDGSPDNCGSICDSYAEKYENITVIHKQNGGLSSARNAGIEKVLETAYETDFITFLDSDDFVHPVYAQYMLELCKNNNCQVAQCDYEKGANDGFELKQPEENAVFSNAEDALSGYTLKSQSCAKIYQISVIKDIRFPTGMINEDEFTTYRLVYNAENVALSNQKLYYYFQHGASIMDDIAKKLKDNPHRFDYLKAYDERIEFFKNENKPVQVLKTREKICTDIILRYCEQKNLEKKYRDSDLKEYIKMYRKNFKLMIHRKGIPFKRKVMYIGFYIMPMSGVLMSKIFVLRK